MALSKKKHALSEPTYNRTTRFNKGHELTYIQTHVCTHAYFYLYDQTGGGRENCFFSLKAYINI